MNYLEAFILGVVEGLTEFIPVSSTGHLIVAVSLLGFSDEQWKVFTIFIQLGAISSIFFAFRDKLFSVLIGLGRKPSSNQFCINIIVAFLPSAFFGVLFYRIIKDVLFSPITVATALVLGGIIIIWFEKKKFTPKTLAIENMTIVDSLKVGCAQCIAMCPGVSRSGATIIGGMFFGLSRTTATQFSFFLAIPTMLGATVYDVYKNWNIFSHGDYTIFLVGFFTAFFSALVTVKILIAFVSKHSFVIFGWYRIAIGLFLIVFWQLGFFEGMELWG